MMSKARSLFVVWARITLVLVYLVIVAGSVVRATGSGMGCPDWPECFGHLIPPTHIEQLQFAEGKEFRKGHFIIWQDALWKATRDVKAGAEINPDDWERYTKHDYAKFNPAHTWTEYLNRLMGALLGIASFTMLILSLRVRREDALLPVLSAVAVFLIGFEAWLGATVVDSNLAPAKITAHMIGAITIVGVMLITLARGRAGMAGAVSGVRVPRVVSGLVVAVLGATVLQIIFGTQVREQVDTLEKLWNGEGRDQWVSQLGTGFKIHAAFAYGVLLLNGVLLYRLQRVPQLWAVVRGAAILMGSLLVVEWAAGVTLTRFGLPAFLQPVHLVVATVIFGLQFRIWRDMRLAGKTVQGAVSSREPGSGEAQPEELAAGSGAGI